MNISEWFAKNKCKTLRGRLATEAETSVGYLEQIVYGKKKAGVPLLERLFIASEKLTPESPILPRDERPDIYRVFSMDIKDKAA